MAQRGAGDERGDHPHGRVARAGHRIPREAIGGRDGAIRISIETEITTANCGREMRAESLQPGSDGYEPVELTLFVPGCEALGDILVLKNVLRDMKIASN